MTDAKTLIRETAAEAAKPRIIGADGKRRLPIGAELLTAGGVHFRLWAPRCREVSVEIDDSTPRITPRMRRRRTNVRVSISLAIGTPWRERNAFASSCDRQLLDSGEKSRTTSP